MLAPYYSADKLIGPYGAAEGRLEYPQYYEHHTGLPWPTIWDPETWEKRPIILPYNVLRTGDNLKPVAIQRGPFLRVVDVYECLALKDEPSSDAEELACVAERVLLQDQGGDVITDDGVTWRRVRTPAGVVGWADGRYLE